jgi:hypothetical protein
MCFTYTARSHNFSTARSACLALGGDMVLYDSPDKQLRVEAYFEKQGSLTPMYYWIGARRAVNGSGEYALLDGTPLPQVPGESPYAHWNWYQPIASAHADYSCVMAYNAYRWGPDWCAGCACHGSPRSFGGPHCEAACHQ